MQHSAKWRIAFRGLAILVLVASATACGGSKATMQEIDGILHVMNPADPLRPNMNIEITEYIRIGEDDGEDDYIFPGITGFIADETGSTYLLMQQDDDVRVFNPDGVYSHRIGRQGQGPGELFQAATINFGPDGNVWVANAGAPKITIFDRAGLYLRDIRFSLIPPLMVQTTSDGFMGLYVQPRQIVPNEVFEITYQLRRFSAEGDTLNTLFSTKIQMDVSDLQLGGLQDQIPFYTIDDQDRVWQTRARTDVFEVNVWNPDGSLDRVIEKEFERIRKSEQEIEEEREMVMRLITAQAGGQLPEGVNIDFDPEPFRPATGLPYFDPRGYVWVQVTKEGTHNANEFDLFNLEGEYQRRVLLPGVNNPVWLSFSGDRLFVQEGDPEVTPQVIGYTVTFD